MKDPEITDAVSFIAFLILAIATIVSLTTITALVSEHFGPIGVIVFWSPAVIWAALRLWSRPPW